MKQHKLGSKGKPFLVSAREAEYKFQQEKNRRKSQMLKQMDEQKIIESILGWLIAARESPKESDASLRLSAKTVYYEILRHLKPSGDLADIKSTLGLPEDIPEPVVGLIWRLNQRIEDLELMVRGPYPLAGLSLRDLDETKESPQLCGEILINFACGEIKGHKGHHIGTRITDNRISWPQQ